MHQAALVFHPHQRPPPLEHVVHNGHEAQVQVAGSPEGVLHINGEQSETEAATYFSHMHYVVVKAIVWYACQGDIKLHVHYGVKATYRLDGVELVVRRNPLLSRHASLPAFTGPQAAREGQRVAGL